MVERIATYLTQLCKKSQPDIDEGYLAVINYGITLVIDCALKVVLLLIIGALECMVLPMLLFLIVFCSYRVSAGGIHMKTGMGCFMMMFVFVQISLCTEYIAFYFGIMSVDVSIFIVIMIVQAIVAGILAPCDTPNNPITDIKIRKRKKIQSVIVLLLIMVAGLFMYDGYRFIIIGATVCETITLRKKKGTIA